MKNTTINFKSLVRQNTGKHMMDSGGDNGRHWQQPIPKQPVTVTKGYNNGLDVSISTADFLEAHLEIDVKLTKWLRKQDANNYSEYAEALAEKLQLTVLCSDNTYNSENDLDQNFQFSAIGPKGADWFYESDGCYIIVETHNGADIRGGYSDPVVCKLKSDQFLDWNCGAVFTKYTDADGIAHDAYEMGEQYSIGYQSAPIYHLNEAIAEVIEVSGIDFKVKLKNGATVKGYIYAHGGNGGDL
jgi:hypothetical protein